MALTTPSSPSPFSNGWKLPAKNVEGFVTAGEALESALNDSPLAKALAQVEAETREQAA